MFMKMRTQKLNIIFVAFSKVSHYNGMVILREKLRYYFA